MRLLLIIIIHLVLSNLSAQTFVNQYILGDDLRQYAYDVHIVDDGYLLTGTGLCDSLPCTFVLKVDKSGDTLWSKTYTEFFAHNRRTALKDSILYMAGEYYRPDGNNERDGFRLFRLNMDGDTLDSRKYDLSQLDNPPVDSIRRIAAHGCIAYGDKIVVYGEVYEHDTGLTDVFSRGLMVWYNEDLSYDTMIVLQPRYEEFDIWDAEVGTDNLLTLMVDDDILINGEQEHYRYFLKYDMAGRRVSETDATFLYDHYWFYMSSAILPQGDMVLYYQKDSTWVKETRALDSVAPDGTINWERRLDPVFDRDFREIYEIAAARDGHVLVTGTYEDFPYLRRGIFLAKYDKDDGRLIWERVYNDWTELSQGDAPRTAVGWRMKVEEEGSIILVGQSRKEIPNDPFDYDILLMRTDSEGCLEEDCGGFEQTVAGTPKYYPIFYVGDLWYHQDPEARDGIYRITYVEFDPQVPEDYFLARGEIRLAVDDVGGFIGIDCRFNFEDDGRKVYSIKDDHEMLLYDFTLDTGDVFSSEYVGQDLQVIDSDTILLLNGEKRRTWTLACLDNPENTITWIEGIGTDYGVLWPQDFCSGDYGDVRLTCYYRYERLHYINENLGGCFLSSTHDPESTLLSDIKVFPNPTSSLLTLTAPPELHIERTELMDAQGRTHTQVHEKTSEVVLDLSGYASGLYFVTVHTEKGSVVKKVVVE